MTVYVDLLFIVNWVINTLMLAGGAMLARERLHRTRVLLGAAMGALYSVLIFFPETAWMTQLVLRLAVGALMVWVAVPTPNIKRYLKALLYFYIVMMVFGGGMYLFYSFTAAGANMVYSNGVYYVDLPLWMLLGLSFGFYGLIRLTAFLQYRKKPLRGLQEIEVCCMDKYRSLTAFVDTGNSLIDPMTLSPVVVVEAGALRGLLPTEVLQAAGCPERLEYVSAKYPDLKCRLIPYKGVGGESCLMFALRPDHIRRLSDGQMRDNVLLGLTSRSLSPDGSYQALLHSTFE